jgi:hypothetical protein
MTDFSITLPSPPDEALTALGKYVRESENPYVSLCVVLSILVDVEALNTEELLGVLQDVGALVCGVQPSARSGFVPKN